MYFLNMYENNKKSIFVERREYVINLLFPKFYTNYVENCAILLTHSIHLFSLCMNEFMKKCFSYPILMRNKLNKINIF